MSIEDVTSRVNAAVKPGLAPEQAFLARRAVTAEIEKESLDKTGLRSDVVMLYQGGQYHLYRYKKYTDVRLVFAPEQQIAFYGGDPDNFEYPRYDLDVCFFRVYDNDKPARIEHYLKWSKAGARAGELVYAGAWDKIAAAVKRQKELARDYNTLEGGQAFSSTLFGFARTLLRGGDERPKPNGERLPEFRDSSRESLEQQLFSEEPIHDDFE